MRSLVWVQLHIYIGRSLCMLILVGPSSSTNISEKSQKKVTNQAIMDVGILLLTNYLKFPYFYQFCCKAHTILFKICV